MAWCPINRGISLILRIAKEDGVDEYILNRYVWRICVSTGSDTSDNIGLIYHWGQAPVIGFYGSWKGMPPRVITTEGGGRTKRLR